MISRCALKTFQFLAKPGWIVLLLALFVFTISILFPAGKAWLGIPAELESLDTTLTYTPQQAFDLLETYSPAQRQAYALMHVTLDLLFPVVFTLTLGAVITYFSKRAFSVNSRWQRLYLLPLFLFMMDLLENTLVISLALTHPNSPYLLALTAGAVTLVKWLAAGLTMAAVAISGLLFIWSFLKRKNNSWQ